MWQSEVAHWLGALPLAWVGILWLRGRRIDSAFIWLTLAFFVSWVADSAAHWVDPWLVGIVYPVTQAVFVACAFLRREDALAFLAVLVGAGVATMATRGADGPDVLLRTVAWLGIVGIVIDRWALGRLRAALLVYFGLGTLAWFAFVLWGQVDPLYRPWYAMQAVRLVGILLFCSAVVQHGPRLRVRA